MNRLLLVQRPKREHRAYHLDRQKQLRQAADLLRQKSNTDQNSTVASVRPARRGTTQERSER
jgi:hypothetical protein